MAGVGDHLDGGQGNDILVLRRSDDGTGGTGLDEFHIQASASDPLVDTSGNERLAEIMDFNGAEDTLTIDYDPLDYPVAPTVSVSITGTDANIFVGLEWIAVVHNAPGLTTADITVAPNYDLDQGLTTI